MHQQIFQSRRVFMILILGVLSGSLAGAQEFKEYPSSARDEKGKSIRSGYIANEWYDNWVIAAGAGVSAVTAKGNTMMVSPGFESGGFEVDFD